MKLKTERGRKTEREEGKQRELEAKEDVNQSVSALFARTSGQLSAWRTLLFVSVKNNKFHFCAVTGGESFPKILASNNNCKKT